MIREQECPMVSIIATAYNSREFLIEALDSVVNQTFDKWELIVVDDGSTDAGRAFIQKAVEGLPRTRLLQQPNRGLPAARNLGVGAARGEFVAFLDHDDVWEPMFLGTMVAALSGVPEQGAVFCRIRHMTESGDCTDKVSNPPLTGLRVEDFLVSDPVCCGSAMLVRRAALEQVGGFDVEMLRAQTPECFIRLLQASWQISGVPDILVRYRNTAGSLMGDNALRKYRQHMFNKVRSSGNFNFFAVLKLRFLMELNVLRIKLRRSLLR